MARNRKPAAPAPAQAPTTPVQAAPAAPVQAPAPAAPAGAFGALVQALQAPAPAPVPAPTPAAPVVALRGGLAVQAVALTKALYRTSAPHNVAWWALVQAQVAAGGGTATVAALLAAGVPAPFVGYTVRRGYLVGVQAPAPAPQP